MFKVWLYLENQFFIEIIVAILIALLSYFINKIITIRNQKYYSWSRITKAVKKIKKIMIEKDIVPDIILSFPKGGLIVADLISMEFDSSIPICSIYTKRTLRFPERKVKVSNDFVDLKELKDKKILIVDDILQSGNTLKEVYHLLTDQYGINKDEIFTAVLLDKEGVHAFMPTISIFKYARKPIILPWGEVGDD